VRTEPDYDQRELVRNRRSTQQLVYKIRIVCQEGAIVRNGIDIDDCENVGNLEMGEIVEAYDRCINSSGVLRYQTRRGWVSEQTRGHGRDQIAEILDLRTRTGSIPFLATSVINKNLKRIECGIPDLRSTCASIMSRLHGSQVNLFSSLERFMVSGIRASSLRDRSQNQSNSINSHVQSLTRILSTNLKKDFEFIPKCGSLEGAGIDTTSKVSSDAAICMYYGNIFNLFHACLYEEKRERRFFNTPLLLNFLALGGWKAGIFEVERDDKIDPITTECGFISAIRFVLQHSLQDVECFAIKEKSTQHENVQIAKQDGESHHSLHQSVSRVVASSFPPVLSLLRRLMSRSLLIDSQMSTILTKMKPSDLEFLLSNVVTPDKTNQTPSFNAYCFTRELHLKLAEVSFNTLSDRRFAFAPAHIVYPWMNFMGEIISTLEEAGKPKQITNTHENPTSSRARSPLSELSDYNQRLARNLSSMSVLLGRPGARPIERSTEPFEPSESSIARLSEMGFTRDHAIEALESTGTNRVEIAMEYALTHPPSSPATRERRRAAREERRLQRERLISSLVERSSNADRNATGRESSFVNDNSAPEPSSNTDEHTETNNDTQARNSIDNDVATSNAVADEKEKLQEEIKMEKEMAVNAKRYLDSIKESFTRISLDIIEGSSKVEISQGVLTTNTETGLLHDDRGPGDGDSDGVTVVMCNFLLNLCTRYPSEIPKISNEILRRLKSNLHVESPSHCRVKVGCESSFAAVAHASVIFFRALPKSRPLILRHGLVGCLTHCVRNVTLTSALRSGKDSSPHHMNWPRWLSPVLLLLEVMAQPTAVSLDETEDEDENGNSKSASKKGEFGRVLAEHKKQSAALAKATRQVFSAIHKDPTIPIKKKKGKDSEVKKKASDAGQCESIELSQSTSKAGAHSAMVSSIPPYLPLILPETAEACMLLCLQLLGLRSKKCPDKALLERVCPPPTVVHAILLLLVRVLHSQKLVLTCLQMGGTDLILSLPSYCRFKGNSGLITMILRRLLEDEPTLQTLMENEIRSLVSKLWKKQRRGSSSETERPKSNLKQFMQAATPIICRDPLVFMKAFASSVKFETQTTESNDNDSLVVLLSTEERAKNTKLMNAQTITGTTCSIHTPNGKKGEDDLSRRGKLNQNDKYQSKPLRSKSPRRTATSRRGISPKSTPETKKERPEGQYATSHKTTKKQFHLEGTPANHVVSLLLREIFSAFPHFNGRHYNDGEEPFLAIPDQLDILSDLVLAIPACAAAIHRFKPPTRILNAISSCTEPPQTAVSFLLHCFIPQPRTLIQHKPGKNTDCSHNDAKKCFMKSRISQSAARLIVCLVARSGEGRRRVISDLIFALSCGHCVDDKSWSRKEMELVEQNAPNEEIEMWALQSWGELCIGLAAPRSNGANQDSNSLLSFEVVRIMLDCGVVHALMFALQQIKLYHPMASSVSSALVRPLEIFTRGSVFKTIEAMEEKEYSKTKLEPSTLDRESRRTTFGPSHRSESAFADDAMLEEGFDIETAERHVRRAARQNYDDIVVDRDVNYSESDNGDDDDDDMIDDIDIDESDSDDENDSTDEDGEIEVQLRNVDYSDPDDIDSEDDEEISSNSSDDEDSDGEDGMDDSDDEMNEDSDSERDDGELFLEGNQGEMLEEEEGWSRDNDDFFEWSAANDANNEVEGILGDSDVDDGMEGWTRVDGEGESGNMVLNVMRSPGHGNHSNRHRGFMIDTAEAVLGNILRSGDLQMDSLSEIEQTLGMQGIRFMHNQREGRSGIGIHIGGTNMSRTLTGNSNNASGISSPSVGTGPAVHQNIPPDFYSLSGIPSNRSLMESNPMEFIFGGPAACAGSACYDLTLSGRAEIRPRFSLPSTYDTQLFPGGIAASIHRGHVEQFSLHPLLCSLELPPLNSMVSTVPPIGHRALTSELQAGTVGATGTFIASPNGNIIRVHSRQLNPSGADQLAGRVGGNIFDGSLIDRASEAYSLSFGHALNALFSNENSTTESVRNETSASNNHLDTAGNVGSDFSRENAMASAGQSPTSFQNDLNDTFDASEEAGALNESDGNLSNPSHGPSSGPGPISETSNSADVGENEANVASSLATGLTISQPDANDSHVSCNAETNTEIAPDANHAGDEVIQEECSEDPPTMSATHTPPDNSPTTETARDDATNNAQNDGASSAIDEIVLNCPPNVDPEVFNSLPIEMQQEIIEQHETTNAVAAQIGETSGLDPEALAALPEDMRREIIQQEQQQQQHRNREQPAADPANAEEMDNASFLASLAPDLRAEILLTADDAFLNSLPPDIIAEAQIIRERATTQQRRRAEEASNASNALGASTGVRAVQHSHNASQDGHATNASRGRRARNGKLRVEVDRPKIVYTPPNVEKNLGPLLTSKSTKTLLRLLYLLSPIQPQRVLQKLFLNICLHAGSRKIFLDAFVSLLNDDLLRVTEVLDTVDESQFGTDLPVGTPTQSNDVFPPCTLIGTAPDLPETGSNTQVGMFRRRPARNSAAAVAASLPASARGSSYEESIPPVVARRIISFLSYLTKASPRICVNMLSPDGTDRLEEVLTYDRKDSSCLERLIDLLRFHLYTKSATNLEQLLNLLESTVAPLSLLPKDTESDFDVSNERSSPGKEWIKVPKVVLSNERIHLLCSVLRLESCKDSSFMKVNTLTRRLSRIEYNRECILDELALVAQGLGADSIRDLKSVSIRLSAAVSLHQQKSRGFQIEGDSPLTSTISDTRYSPNTPSSAVSLSTSSSELKLLRVLQTLHSLCNEYTQDEATKGDDGNTPEFIALLRSLDLEALWDQLAECLRKVSILEGVAQDDEVDDNELESDGNDSDAEKDGLEGKNSKKLQNSVAGLITRFLPAIEAFFIVNTVSISEERTRGSSHENASQDKNRLVQFVASNKILLNALLRSNPHLLEKGLKALAQTPKCRPFLDFDVKRQWFKTQVRRLRQQASRRHGSLRLSLRRKHVFEDAFHAFIHRNAEELRGRLHITFQNEEGVDAGGLSREFFAILAKEMFNPNYALFMSTEDGCTFQPNPNSSINPDDLRYFRFVGRIVGKAVVDGFLLDAHFTRSLYKHMLGIKPTHQDMQAIDPDYYKNLQMILQHNLEDIGLELTFSTEDHSFGRSQTLDLIPNGRNISVTEETKARYVDLVCEHRMTMAIEKQIKAYLEGFYEMVDPDLISIFTAKELELLISGMPEIDIDDLKKNTEYNGYRPADREIGWFWNIMFSLSRSEKAAFLQFVTGSSKVPLAGFSELQGMRGVQKFSINKASGSAGALMSAHTCFNALDLPVYKSEDEMKEKLLYAISEGGGGFLFA